jgi:hypothetical protein
MWDYLIWGRLTIFMPTMVLLLAVLAGAMLAVVRRLVVAVSAGARRFDASARSNAITAAHRFRLDDIAVAASCALLGAVAVLVAISWYFTPLLLAFMTDASTGARENLRLLSPDFVEYHNRYRQVLTGVVILTVAFWFPVVRLMKKGQSLHWGFIVGGVVSFCVAMAFLHFPYRLLYFNNRFDVVTWNNQRCYVTGERASEMLLFCPDARSPRNRIVDKADKGVVPLGVRESIFSRFGSVVPDPIE